MSRLVVTHLMKRLSRRCVTTAAALCLAAVVPACNFYPEAELVYRPPVAARDLRTKVVGAFLDAKTKAPVSAEITVVARGIDGHPQPGLRDTDGRSSHTFVVKDGVLALMVVDEVLLPQELVLVAHAPGHLPAIARVRLEQRGPVHFVAHLVSVADPPAGVSIVEAELGPTDAEGRLPDGATLRTAEDALAGGRVELVLPPQTRVLKSNQQPLKGPLTATLAYFSNVQAASLAAFPGGFEAHVPPAPGAAAEPGTFHSAGFAAIDIRDASGARAAVFDRAVPFTYSLNAITAPAAASEPTLPFWTRDFVTGAWRNEGAVQVVDDPAEGIRVHGTTKRTSWMNVAWFQPLAACEVGRTVALGGSTHGVHLSLELLASFGYRAWMPLPSNEVGLTHVRGDLPVTLQAQLGRAVVGTAEVENLCLGGDVTLPLSAMPDVHPAQLVLEARMACVQNPEQQTGVPAGFALFGDQGQVLFATADASGKTTVEGLVAGAQYRIVARSFDGASHPAVQLVPERHDDAVVLFETRVDCPALSGAVGGN